MFLPKECDYAIRVVRALSDMEIKPVKIVCEHEQVPHYFAYKILKKLERANIVRSYRGAEGGYQLTKTLDSITLFDIVNAVNKQLLVSECLKKGFVCVRNLNENSCGVHRELIRVQALLMEAFNEKTMDKLL